jgi:integrase
MGEQYRDQGLIFAAATGDIMQAENLPHRLFRQLLKGAEGEHPKVVQERLGHSSIQLTLDTYSHVVPGMQERATERLEAMFSTPAATTAAKA